MAQPSPPSPEQLAELARQGEAIRREAERLVTDALRAVAGDPAVGPEAARDVAEYLARRPAPARGEAGKILDGDEQDNTG